MQPLIVQVYIVSSCVESPCWSVCCLCEGLPFDGLLPLILLRQVLHLMFAVLPLKFFGFGKGSLVHPGTEQLHNWDPFPGLPDAFGCCNEGKTAGDHAAPLDWSAWIAAG